LALSDDMLVIFTNLNVSAMRAAQVLNIKLARLDKKTENDLPDMGWQVDSVSRATCQEELRELKPLSWYFSL
jgi:imidazoleglycerol phosphate synthase glutamine amidotransferase subunit HisH